MNLLPNPIGMKKLLSLLLAFMALTLYAQEPMQYRIVPVGSSQWMNPKLSDEVREQIDRIAADGYKIAYCKEAYALETPSADLTEEGKRKRRIAAGGLQSVWRLRKLLNPFHYGVLWFQYVSHRVLRWTVTPVALAALVPLNVALLWSGHPELYAVILALQALFYLTAAAGWMRERRGRQGGVLSVPYYFLFMNLNVFRGAWYLATHRGRGAWEKARRA